MEIEPLSGKKLWMAVVGLAIATFLIILDYSIANIAIPHIVGDLGSSSSQGVYLITFFAIGNAISLPMAGFFSDKFGRVRTFLLSMFLFVLLSWICGLSGEFYFLVAARFFQGFASGPFMPVVQSLIMDISPSEKRSSIFGTWATIAVVAPVAGPILGGWISTSYTWPWIFYINIPVGTLAFCLVYVALKDRIHEIHSKAVDWVGFCLLALAVTTLQILLDKGQEWDWFNNKKIWALTIISSISFIYLVTTQLILRFPLLDLRLFKKHSFRLSIIFLVLMYQTYFGALVLIPFWLQSSMGYDSIWAGVAVAPIGIPTLIFAKFVPGWIDRFGFEKMLFVALLFFMGASFYSSFHSTDMDLWHIMRGPFLYGCGSAFMMQSLIRMSMSDVENERQTKAAGIFHFFRATAGAVGTALFIALFTRRTAFHHSKLASTIMGSNVEGAELFDQLKSLSFSVAQATTVVNDITTKQASVMGLNDCFWLMGWICVGLSALLLLCFKHSTKPVYSSEIALE